MVQLKKHSYPVHITHTLGRTDGSSSSLALSPSDRPCAQAPGRPAELSVPAGGAWPSQSSPESQVLPVLAEAGTAPRGQDPAMARLPVGWLRLSPGCHPQGFQSIADSSVTCTTLPTG